MSRKEIGAFVYQQDDEGLKVMLVTNRQQTRWILPKGQAEKDLTDKEVAHDEAYEEAGVIGTIDRRIKKRKIKYKTRTGPVTLHVYTMQLVHVFEQWPESYFRQRKMVTIDTAIKMVTKKSLKKLLQQLGQVIS